MGGKTAIERREDKRKKKTKRDLTCFILYCIGMYERGGPIVRGKEDSDLICEAAERFGFVL